MTLKSTQIAPTMKIGKVLFASLALLAPVWAGQSKGDIRVLVLLIRWSEHGSRELPTPDVYEAICGEMGDYFRQQSYNQYNIVDCDVQDWFSVGLSEQEFSQGKSGQLGDASEQFFWSKLDAMDQAAAAAGDLTFWNQYDADVDGKIDALLVFHSGYGAEFPGADCQTGTTSNNRMFSQGHSASVNGWESGFDTLSYLLSSYAIVAGLRGTCNANPPTLGLSAHEFFHTFQGQPPDLYDPTLGGAGGTGGYDIMSQPYGATGRNGDAPGSLGPWMKQFVGWADLKEITEDGTYTLRPSMDFNDYYIITEPFPEGEYLMLEYRKPDATYDADFYGEGLIVWHIDDSQPNQSQPGFPGQQNWPQNGKHYRVAISQAGKCEVTDTMAVAFELCMLTESTDGNFDLEQGRNIGELSDLYTAGMSIGPGSDGSFPNTDSYKSGIVSPTGVVISVVSVTDDLLTFQVGGIAPATPTPPTPPVAAPAPAPSGSTPGNGSVPAPGPTGSGGNGSVAGPSPDGVTAPASAACRFMASMAAAFVIMFAML